METRDPVLPMQPNILGLNVQDEEEDHRTFYSEQDVVLLLWYCQNGWGVASHQREKDYLRRKDFRKKK